MHTGLKLWRLDALCLGAILFVVSFTTWAEADPLPSWKDGPAKNAIISFVKETTDKNSPNFIAPENRIAAFDQDGTLWVEHPIYTQVVYSLDRIRALVGSKPQLADVEPFKTIVSGNIKDIMRLDIQDMEKALMAVLTGMSVEDFSGEVRHWIQKAKHPRWDRLYTELVYQPMIEVIQFLRSSDYKIFVVTGGGQDFVREYSEKVYGIPPENVIGTAVATQYGYDKTGKPILTREPKLLLYDDKAGKPEGIHFMTGRRPQAAFGNSTGDRQMLEYTRAGDGERLCMLVLHDDADREYAYGPALGLPDTKIGTFTQELYDQAIKRGWLIISIKNDWKRVFPFEK